MSEGLFYRAFKWPGPPNDLWIVRRYTSISKPDSDFQDEQNVYGVSSAMEAIQKSLEVNSWA